jgi:hypothetical protein
MVNLCEKEIVLCEKSRQNGKRGVDKDRRRRVSLLTTYHFFDIFAVGHVQVDQGQQFFQATEIFYAATGTQRKALNFPELGVFFCEFQVGAIGHVKDSKFLQGL